MEKRASVLVRVVALVLALVLPLAIIVASLAAYATVLDVLGFLVATVPLMLVLLRGIDPVRWRTALPPVFGVPDRDARMNTFFRREQLSRSYRPLYDIARQVVGTTTSPYLAAVRLEDWFRTGGGFSYVTGWWASGMSVIVAGPRVE